MELLSSAFGIAFCLHLITNTFLKNQSLRRFILLAINLLFIALVLKTPINILALFVFISLSYLALHVNRKLKNIPYTLSMSILTLTFIFCYLKGYFFLNFIPKTESLASTLGLSYVYFRAIHLLVDTKEDTTIKIPSFPTYIHYCCFYLSFLSGPIERYESFSQPTTNSETVQSNETYTQYVKRFVLGCFKVIFLSHILFNYHEHFTSRLILPKFESIQFVLFSGASLLYFYFLYFNFSGYMDLVISAGNIVGKPLPENFNKPLKATSLIKFWTRWHITLSDWFKYYIFNPLMKTLLQNKTLSKHPFLIGILAYFITFLLMGVWHGPTPAFLYFGLLMGLGISVNKLYEHQTNIIFDKNKLKNFHEHLLIKQITRAITLSFFALSLASFWMKQSLSQYQINFPEIILSFIFLISMLIIIQNLVAILMQFTKIFKKPFSSNVTLTISIFCFCLLILYAFETRAQLPEFVYQHF